MRFPTITNRTIVAALSDALPPTLDLPASDPMASLPWPIPAWHGSGGEGEAGESRSGCQVKAGHRDRALI